LVAGAIAATCLGAVLAAWAWWASTDTEEVLVASTSIPWGAVIEAGHLTQASISADPVVDAIAASRSELVVGQRAALDIAAGGLVTPESVSDAVLPPTGKSVVGIALSPAQAPARPLQAGDQVRVVSTPGEGGEAVAGPPPYSEAEVVGMEQDAETGQTVVDLMVPEAEATLLAARIATGSVAIVLDSRER